MALELRKRLWYQNPYCYWCGQLTIIGPKPKGISKNKYRETLATIDHLYSRYHPCKRPGNQNAVVLACQRCNSHRGGFESRHCNVHDITPLGGVAQHPKSAIERLTGTFLAMNDFYLFVIPEHQKFFQL